MKLLFIIRRFALLDGSTQVLLRFIRSNNEIKECVIACRFAVDRPDDIEVREVSSPREMALLLQEGHYDIINYYKTSGYDLFDWTLDAMRKLRLRVPVITTVCQRPSYPTLLLSARELKESDKIIFIDHTALADPLLGFLPSDRKACIYFGYDRHTAELTASLAGEFSPDSGKVVFGRGSTPSKVPADAFDIFDRIKVAGKRFVVVGIPADSDVAKAAEGHEGVQTVPPLPYDKWLAMCASFDIFLYYIPANCHSSIDGTLGAAMLLEKPVVYCGPGAPAERLNHGVNGFVANNADEIVEYCERLASDPELRKKMGKAARESTVRDFSIDASVKAYNALFREMTGGEAGKPSPFDVPLSYRIHFFRHSGKEWLKSKLGGSWIERMHFSRKPITPQSLSKKKSN